jgi:hypothetical protein
MAQEPDPAQLLTPQKLNTGFCDPDPGDIASFH